jgi:microcystin-dependent protein
MGGGTGRQAGTSPDSALGKSDNGSSTNSGNANITTTVASAGVSGVNQNLPPYLTINFIIKT